MADSSKTRKVIPFRGRNAYDAEAEKAANVIGTRIAEARKKSGMSLVAFSEFLKGYGVDVRDAALSKWETGRTIPNAYQLMAIICALGLEDEPRFFMESCPQPLNEAGLRKLAEYKADLIATGKYRPTQIAKSAICYREMPVSTLAVSAGTGAFLDEGNFEVMRFPEDSIPDGAEFGIRVSGNSMEPVYHDGQIVWIQQCSELSIGQVGVFIYDNEGYIKAYDEKEPDENMAESYTDSFGVVRPQPVLISYNEDYPPKVVSPYASFQIVGRVLR